MFKKSISQRNRKTNETHKSYIKTIKIFIEKRNMVYNCISINELCNMETTQIYILNFIHIHDLLDM